MCKAIRALASLVLYFCVYGVFSVTAHAQKVPKELQPPANQHLLLQLHAKGNQIYTCKEAGAHFGWTLKEPEAQLFGKDGKPFGRHFAGPSWETNDGSSVTGKAVANVPSPEADSIPWLLITVTSHRREGMLGRVTSIQRINTKGGKAPASGCDAVHAGREARALYAADYVFFGSIR